MGIQRSFRLLYRKWIYELSVLPARNFRANEKGEQRE